MRAAHSENILETLRAGGARPGGPESLASLLADVSLLARTGPRDRFVERYLVAGAPIVDRVAFRLRAAAAELRVSVATRVSSTRPLLIDPWRVERGLIGLALAVLAASSGRPSALRIGFERRGDAGAFRATSCPQAAGGVADPSAPSADSAALGLLAAGRAAEAHGGWVALSLEPERELNLWLPADPEAFRSPSGFAASPHDLPCRPWNREGVRGHTSRCWGAGSARLLGGKDGDLNAAGFDPGRR